MIVVIRMETPKSTTISRERTLDGVWFKTKLGLICEYTLLKG